MFGFDWLYYTGGLPTVLCTLFWIWMLIECIQNDPDRGVWIWILIIVPCPGAIIYFFLRRLELGFNLPAFAGRWTRRRELLSAEAEARAIGNAYHYVQYGDLLMETHQYRKAAEAYGQAIEKEPDDLEALWGAAWAESHLKDYEQAEEHLLRLLELDSKFRFGEPSLLLGRALAAQGKRDAAITHMRKHVATWPRPHAKVLLARLLAEAGGDEQEIRQLCEDVLDAIRFSPRFKRGESAALRREAKRLLRRI